MHPCAPRCHPYPLLQALDEAKSNSFSSSWSSIPAHLYSSLYLCSSLPLSMSHASSSTRESPVSSPTRAPPEAAILHWESAKHQAVPILFNCHQGLTGASHLGPRPAPTDASPSTTATRSSSLTSPSPPTSASPSSHLSPFGSDRMPPWNRHCDDPLLPIVPPTGSPPPWPTLAPVSHHPAPLAPPPSGHGVSPDPFLCFLWQMGHQPRWLAQFGWAWLVEAHRNSGVCDFPLELSKSSSNEFKHYEIHINFFWI
jgi:hypothetical protein